MPWRRRILGCFVAGMVLALLVAYLVWTAGWSNFMLPVVLIAPLWCLAMFVASRRARRVYRDGVLATATVQAVSGAERVSGLYGYSETHLVTVVVAYQISGAPLQLSRCVSTALELRVRAGDEIPILYARDKPARVAVYLPEVGLVPGVPHRGTAKQL